MKKFRQFFACFVLTLVFTLSAFAGDIPFPGETNPPPPPSVLSDTSTPDATSNTSPSDAVVLDPLTETTISLLQSVNSLF
jgi:hypothetical protein